MTKIEPRPRKTKKRPVDERMIDWNRADKLLRVFTWQIDKGEKK